MNKRITYYFALTFLVVFALYAVPHEAVHFFYNHNDTKHESHAEGQGAEISTIHIHCDFLNFYESEFLPPSNQAVHYSLDHKYRQFFTLREECISYELLAAANRGPPTI